MVLAVGPTNWPSIRVIEKLGAVYLEKIAMPKDDPAHSGGAREKLRYRWAP